MKGHFPCFWSSHPNPSTVTRWLPKDQWFPPSLETAVHLVETKSIKLCDGHHNPGKNLVYILYKHEWRTYNNWDKLWGFLDEREIKIKGLQIIEVNQPDGCFEEAQPGPGQLTFPREETKMVWTQDKNCSKEHLRQRQATPNILEVLWERSEVPQKSF